ncbi:MAG: class I SAM-dependent RNA methyltransferase [Alphaproteobacteria bacterium]|nr:class I SAM-dependent RNA methyltransferase [Alphaproteobacteria bacterium]
MVLCPYFGKCGGCLYQDMAFETYLERKKAYVLRCFADYGLTPTLEKIATVPVHSRRRATFAFNKGHLGFNAYKSHQIIDIDSCLMLTDNLVALIPTLRNLAKTLGGTGDIHVLDTPFGIDMHLKTAKSKDRPSLILLETLGEFVRSQPIARLLYNNDPIAEKVALPFVPDVFLQPSQAGEDILIALMCENIQNAKTAIDLFCGTGTFTKPLLKAGLTVMGYDSATDSVKALGINGTVRDLFRNPLLPSEFDGVDFVVIDPPRAGAKAQIEQLAQTNVPKIVMISCNPSTCARDVKVLLDNGWQLDKITPVDQFTYSNHIELVCILSKKAEML